MQIKSDVSYGVIPIKKSTAGWEVFLIHQFSKIGNNSYWIFPKGHPEENETPIETAKRELKEETGLEADYFIPNNTFKLKYNFIFEGVKINKTVEFFVGIITNDQYQLDNNEVKEAGWYSLSDAKDRLDYQDTKKVFKEVVNFLQSSQFKG